MRAASFALGLLLAAAWLAPANASAAEGQHVLIETLGSANQASFVEPRGLAVDQGSGEIYAIDGRSELQKITVAATGGKFKLRFGTETTTELPYDASAGQLEAALTSIVCPGAKCIVVPLGKGDPTGSSPYLLEFGYGLFTTDVEEIQCEDGGEPLSGPGASCTVETTRNGVNGTISRWQADGSPAEFSVLGSNAIDGLGPGPDQTPLAGLHFPEPRLAQIVVDESGGETDGDIYATQSRGAGSPVFAPSGAYLARLTEYKQGPLAEGSLSPFSSSCGVGVDGNGDIYLGDASQIHKYDPAANPVANSDSVANFDTAPSPCTLSVGAGPTTGFLFATGFFEELFKLDATTGALQYGGNPIATGITTVTVDPLSGYLYAAKNPKGGSNFEVLVFDASGASAATLVESIPIASKITGIAVDGNAERLYVARKGSSHLDVYAVLVIPRVETGAASEVGKTTATVGGTLDPEGAPLTECRFEYGETESYGQSAPCDTLDGAPISGPGDIPADESTHSVSADISGLQPNTTYHYRLVAANATAPGKGEDEIFTTLGPPVVKAESVSGITASEAAIDGEVDPRGEATEVAVEYVSEAEFDESGYAEASVSDPEEIGEGVGFVEFSQELTGLQPDTTYHFRILADNQVDPPVHGEDKTFTTFDVPTGLPEGRAWEQVSPAQKIGEVFPPEPDQHGGLGGSCFHCTPGWDRQRMPMQASPDGEAVAYEGSPFQVGLAAGNNEYVSRRGPAGWTTAGLSKPQYQDNLGTDGFKAFSPDLSRAVLVQGSKPSLTPEAPTSYANLYIQEEGKEALATLITVEPPNRSPEVEGGNAFRVTYAGANAGSEGVSPLTHVIFQANDALTEEEPGVAPEAPPVEAEETNLYEWAGGELHLLNVLPGNATAVPDAVIGSGELLRVAGGENFDFDHAISDDGSRIFWSEKSSGQVYLREGAESTIQIPDPGKFLTASADGSKVLLSNGHLYGLEDESTIDLSEEQGGFQGIAGASEDLSRVYFVDTAALTGPGEENANGEAAEAGEPNLYLYDEGATSFLATLLPSDNDTGGGQLGVWHAAPGDRLAQVSPDGRFLAFESRAPLTGYDSTIAEGEGCVGTAKLGIPQCFEVFAYDAQTGKLTCASCNPIGRRPLGLSNLALISSDRGSFPQPHNLPDAGEGRLFFESQDVLSAADANGHIQDVYEWQPEGVGGCKRASGCISLISSGHGPKDSYFLDATPSGSDAFFITRDALVPQDIDGDFMDVYDARVNGGIPEVLNPPCEGQACKGPAPQAPSEPTAASATFSGPGNQGPKRCAKGKVRKRGKCVKRSKSRHRHTKSSRRSTG
jgi:hypothetical protein